MMVTKAITAITSILSSSTTRLASTSTPATSTAANALHSKKMSSNHGGIICAGLSCLDLQLLGCTQSGSDEAIERYDEAIHCAGGSSSMTGTTLALLLRNNDDDNDDAGQGQEEVHILTKIGPDFAGNTLLEFYRRAGAITDLVLTDPSARTSMAVLPVFQNGKRGCFVNLACNDGFSVKELLGQLDGFNTRNNGDNDGDDGNSGGRNARAPRAFLFGYPHLMPKMQGEELSSMLHQVRQKLSLHRNDNEDDNASNNHGILVGVDLNGVDGSDANAAREALIPALSAIDVLHLNEDEAKVLSSSTSGDDSTNNNKSDDAVVDSQMLSQISSFHKEGCAVVLLSLGSKGAFVSVTPDATRLQQLSSACCASSWTPGTQVRVPAFQIPHGDVNANGAGDALFSGFCLAASSWGVDVAKKLCQGDAGGEWEVTPEVAGMFASLVAWQRCDAITRDGDGMRSAKKLMTMIKNGELPEALES